MIGLIADGVAGRRSAAELAGRFGPDAAVVEGAVAPALRRVWPELDSVVLFTSTEAAVRAIAPLVRDELTDPAVVCVDDRAGFAVVLAGGAGGAANALAEQVADVLGCEAVVTGSVGRAGTVLDEVVSLTQSTVVGDLAGCAAAVVAGEPVRLVNPLGFALPPLPPATAVDVDSPAWTLVIDDRRPVEPDPAGTVRLIPRTLVVGIGASSEASRTAVADTVALLDTEHGLDPRAVRACASSEAKAEQAAVLDAVQDLEFWHAPDGEAVPLLSFPAHVLDAVEVPNPSERVRQATGSAGIAEAAALRGATDRAAEGRGSAGRGAADRGAADRGAAELVVAKTAGRGVTVAAARVLPRGRFAVLDIGPGEPDLRTPRADAELRRASVVVGTDRDVDRVRYLLRPGTEIASPAPATPADGIAEAWELAATGRAVALIGSTGSGIAEVAESVLATSGTDVELVAVPGSAAPAPPG